MCLSRTSETGSQWPSGVHEHAPADQYRDNNFKGFVAVWRDRERRNSVAMAGMMKKRYCQGDKSNCARWVVRGVLGPTSVPIDLFPNQMDRAEALIKRVAQ